MELSKSHTEQMQINYIEQLKSVDNQDQLETLRTKDDTDNHKIRESTRRRTLPKKCQVYELDMLKVVV